MSSLGRHRARPPRGPIRQEHHRPIGRRPGVPWQPHLKSGKLSFRFAWSIPQQGEQGKAPMGLNRLGIQAKRLVRLALDPIAIQLMAIEHVLQSYCLKQGIQSGRPLRQARSKRGETLFKSWGRR